ncbi:TetR/AcrR family transcriptional regulator [Pseudomonas cremoricolorata]|uniref:TetR/AcrR family transcriptional regulator n=1 Tax=Pseudomonas cremoricolorata TaxID=157783 RepID=UPI0003FD319F|nr:TetR/AcrR family transcriptional regulator [Pseudomonas cremoricolorata]
MAQARRSRAHMIEETRAKLITTARSAFAEHGFANTSMDDFTAAVGLTRGALHHHFGNKEGLLIAVIEQIETEVNEHLRQVSAAAPNRWEGFRQRCRTYLQLALEPEIRRIILQDARAVFGDVPAAAQSLGVAELQAALDQLLADGVIAALPTPVMARMIYGAVTEASCWIAEPDADLNERLHQALDALERLLDGLRVTGEHP